MNHGRDNLPSRGSGRPRNTNTLDDRESIRVATSSPTASLESVRHNLPSSRHPVVSRKTLQRRLPDAGIRSQRPLRWLPLTPHHTQCRLDVFQPQAIWRITNWRLTFFNYEYRFSFNADDQFISVWRRLGHWSLPGICC
ncbi:HTH_Tnp_Tc3_2 domain-containing protein [Trichonephila clavipes]|nr:HTH_Tnp_Tc3_2 domain-containing protein [Trichonephila clavipes]